MNIIPRPTSNRRSEPPDYDLELENALLSTLSTPDKAVEVSLARFHSSPAKGRLWYRGLKVRHRVINPNFVAAWVTKEVEE